VNGGMLPFGIVDVERPMSFDDLFRKRSAMKTAQEFEA